MGGGCGLKRRRRVVRSGRVVNVEGFRGVVVDIVMCFGGVGLVVVVEIEDC